MDEVHGGSPYGAGIVYIFLNFFNLSIWLYVGTLSGGDGSRQPSQLETQVAEHQGKTFAYTAIALKVGRAAAAESGQAKKEERAPSAKK